MRWRRHKALSTLTTIVAVTENGDYKLKLHSSICSDESYRGVAALVVLITSSDAGDSVGTCEQQKLVDTLVLFTSPTTLCVVPVTCNNNTPILQHFMDKFAEFVC